MNQRLEIQIPGTSGVYDYGARLVSKFLLSADFDVQVDFHLLDWPFSNGVRMALAIDEENGVERTSFGSELDHPEWPREVYLTEFLDGAQGITETDDLTGKLRLARTGGTQTGYYYDSGKWVTIHAGSAPTGDVAIQLHAWSREVFFMDQDVFAALDNLRVLGEIVSSTGNETGYGAGHFSSALQSRTDPENPVLEFGPVCMGTLPSDSVTTHYYRVRVPNNNDLLRWNPFSIEVAAWECVGGVPIVEADRCCFDVTLLPAWEPPPVPERLDGFVVEEIDGPPLRGR